MTQECEKTPDKLYRIGMFSKMNQVTIKTLRYYDEVGLLKPHFIDPDNGYRYYISSQLAPLHRLLALRRMGYNIDEIKQVQAGESERRILHRKRQQLMREITERMAMLTQIEGYLQQEEDNYQMIVKRLPAVIVASMRMVVPNFDRLFSMIPEMGLQMETAGCVCALPEYCFTIYHDNEYKEENIDVEVCEAVTEMKDNQGNLTFKQIEEVPEAVCTVHKGAYTEFPKAYAAVIQFAENNGYRITGPFRESYIDGIWNKESEEEWLTEIQLPVEKISR
ncbi:MerR family transcriptional regulator [Enterococcus casseliflavus]|uniref:MerR family transcriptional regulator n=1 Tax=Enterococcus casseliflavus TaxID=37734 RepID=UPI0008EF11AC|nr:MerR family transcriptional regulator [Enterococcus casseliflavus]MBE6170627.1 MerR family transcriptional regulator [Enterococcus casseliflavus]NKD31606.1 MerR family transcriptional regulator [Enterococcus casseliflavus]SFE38676.1 DNA-binding transcriptional regulator, MerR family [Enterococcus casseliflavus]